MLLSGVLLLASFGAVGAVFGTGIAGSTNAGSFPPAGTDAMGASSSVGIQMPCGTGATDTLQLNGNLIVERSNPTPGPNGDQFTTQLQSLQLSGLDPTLGLVQMMLNPSMNSTGAVMADGSASDFPARSFFDVFTDISIDGGGQLSNPSGSPADMTTDGITTIPPIGAVFTLQGGPVPLDTPAGAEQACIVSAQLTLNSQPPGPVVGTLNTGPSSIDHFACYGGTNLATTTGTLFNIPPIVQLNNQFGGFYGLVGQLVYHCNPTQKTLPPVGGVTTPPTPITNPNAHLACFKLKVPSPQPPMTVQMTNQFGTGTLTTNQPKLLCVPSWKNLVGTAVTGLSEPPGLDHYVCYSVTQKVMPATPPGILLQDQFNNMQSPPTQTTVTLGAPNLACLPSLKTTNAATAVPVPGTYIHPEAHMVCYPITSVANQASPTGGTVTDFNQFGVGVVTIGALSELCVPSLKSQRVPTNTIVVSKTVQADPLTGGAGIAGAVFQAVPSNPSNPTVSCTTDASGTCSITGLAIDTYTVSEVSAPPPFNVTLAAPQTVVFTSAPQTKVLGFNDPLPQGSNTIDITKVTNPNSAGGGTPLGGATFTAVPTVNPANPIGSCMTTLPSGTCQITGLGVDTYLVSETVPPSGYAPVAPQTVTFTTSPQTQTLTIFDNPITTQVGNTLVITKLGLRSVKLAGAVFTAVPSNPINPPGTCTSTATGTCTMTGLGIDTYTLVETKPPTGYNPAPTSTVTFTLAPQTIAVKITDPVVGATG